MKPMRTEQDFINSVKESNARLFAADKIQIKPESLESLLRRAYRAGKQDSKSEPIDYPEGFEQLFGRFKQ